MKRRHLLLSGAAAAATALGWRYWRATDEAAILAVLRKRLHYLRMDEIGLQRFAHDMARSRFVSSARLHLLGVAGPLYSRPDLDRHNFLTDGIRHGEERIITNYLMSSDFFLHGADESRLIRYLSPYDPVRACGNPFARLT